MKRSVFLFSLMAIIVIGCVGPPTPQPSPTPTPQSSPTPTLPRTLAFEKMRAYVAPQFLEHPTLGRRWEVVLYRLQVLEASADPSKAPPGETAIICGQHFDDYKKSALGVLRGIAKDPEATPAMKEATLQIIVLLEPIEYL